MEEKILKELQKLQKLISEQNMLKKEVLNFLEACQYLDISGSHLYRLTSLKQVPHFCPQGKRLYFNRQELDKWLQQKRQKTVAEINSESSDYVIKIRRTRHERVR
jgi:excisionase family DNA binding protein